MTFKEKSGTVKISTKNRELRRHIAISSAPDVSSDDIKSKTNFTSVPARSLLSAEKCSLSASTGIGDELREGPKKSVARSDKNRSQFFESVADAGRSREQDLLYTLSRPPPVYVLPSNLSIARMNEFAIAQHEFFVLFALP
mmetsp:Transcript_15075/g.33164  ORF Transcript_15075/g.33164 Transcript_15075/m.33164 type:complete len:141 (+) Transcript_15075:2901-3323(+)